MTDAHMNKYFSGEKLYGDDFNETEIAAWLAAEENGYFDLVGGCDGGGYNLLNSVISAPLLSGRRLEVCVALGCAGGEDLIPLAAHVDRFIAIEPAEKWWKSEIGGRPAQFMKPTLLGDIALPERSVDLVTCFGVLHHIANVSRVVKEIGRVLRPGGLLLLREPIHSMGDWRRPRRGLTKNERGIPIKFLEQMLAQAELRITKRYYCQAPTTWRIAGFFGKTEVYSSIAWVYFDLLTCRILQYNAKHYHRKGITKLAPGAVLIAADKTNRS